MELSKKVVVLLSLFLLVPSLQAQVLILTYHHNRPDLIELQYRMLKKFLVDDFELVAFNDASKPDLENEIRTSCYTLGVECVRIPQEIHVHSKQSTAKGDPASMRHGDCINYSLQKRGFSHDDIVLILDGDMFLMREFCLRDFLGENDAAVWIKNRNEHHEYFCPVFCALNMSKIPEKEMLNFSPGVWGDTGAHTFLYLQKYQDIVALKKISVIYADQLYLTTNPQVDGSVTLAVKIATYKHFGFTDREVSFLLKGPPNFHIIADNSFIHYCDSSKRHRDDQYHDSKTEIIRNYLLELLN